MQAPILSRLQLNERRAVEAFVDGLRRDLDGRLLLLVLFGSKARGDDQSASDIDFLVVTDGETREMERRLSSLTASLGLEHDVLINTLSFSRDRWADFARRRAAFWQNVQRDGLVLLRAPRLPNSLAVTGTSGPDPNNWTPDHQPEITTYLASAWQALRTAESQFLLGSDYLLVANRAYYAIFYAANAVLATEGRQLSRHPAVLARFRELFVKAGAIEASYLQDYEEVMKRRHLSDYDLHALVSADFVRVSLEAAQRFVSRIERYLHAHGFLAT
jgi:uncharacterized protein (UPF0332 family)/predicted nucleotidyltransferase